MVPKVVGSSPIFHPYWFHSLFYSLAKSSARGCFLLRIYSPHIFFILFIAISRLQDKRPLYLMCRFSSDWKVPAGFTAWFLVVSPSSTICQFKRLQQSNYYISVICVWKLKSVFLLRLYWLFTKIINFASDIEQFPVFVCGILSMSLLNNHN